VGAATVIFWLPLTIRALVVPLPSTFPLLSVTVHAVPADIGPLPAFVTVKTSEPPEHLPDAERLDLFQTAVTVTVGVAVDCTVVLVGVAVGGILVLVTVAVAVGCFKQVPVAWSVTELRTAVL
jgi:hypothetical protein